MGLGKRVHVGWDHLLWRCDYPSAVWSCFFECLVFALPTFRAVEMIEDLLLHSSFREKGSFLYLFIYFFIVLFCGVFEARKIIESLGLGKVFEWCLTFVRFYVSQGVSVSKTFLYNLSYFTWLEPFCIIWFLLVDFFCMFLYSFIFFPNKSTVIHKNMNNLMYIVSSIVYSVMCRILEVTETGIMLPKNSYEFKLFVA